MKEEQTRERILARSARLFNRRREAIGKMRFATGKKGMTLQDTPSIDYPMPRRVPIRSGVFPRLPTASWVLKPCPALVAWLVHDSVR